MKTTATSWVDGLDEPEKNYDIDAGFLTLVHNENMDTALDALQAVNEVVDAAFRLARNGGVAALGRHRSDASTSVDNPLTAMCQREPVKHIVIAARPDDPDDLYPDPFMVVDAYTMYGRGYDVEVHYTPSWIIQFIFELPF